MKQCITTLRTIPTGTPGSPGPGGFPVEEKANIPLLNRTPTKGWPWTTRVLVVMMKCRIMRQTRGNFEDIFSMIFFLRLIDCSVFLVFRQVFDIPFIVIFLL